jgi:hypothetical protein
MKRVRTNGLCSAVLVAGKDRRSGLRVICTASLLVFFWMLGSGWAIAQENPQISPPPASASATEPPRAAAEAPGPAIESPGTAPTQQPPQPEAQPQPVLQPSLTAAPSPALNLSEPPVRTDKDESLVEKWWFWSAIGAVVVGTVVAIVLIDGGSSTPRTTLGNQEFRP